MPGKLGKNYMKSKKATVKHEPAKMDIGRKWDTPDFKLKIGGGEVAGISTTTIIIIVIIVVVVAIAGYFLFFNKSSFFMVSNSPIRFLTPNKTEINKDRPLINENHSIGCAFAKNNAACDPTREIFGENDDINIRNMVEAQQTKIFRDLQVPVKKIVQDNNDVKMESEVQQTNSPLYNQMMKDISQGDNILDNNFYVNRNDIPSIIRNSTENDYYGDYIKNKDIGTKPDAPTTIKNNFGGYPMP